MLQMRAMDWQPGTGTRYLVLVGKVDDPKDAHLMGCDVGAIYLVWEGMGAYSFIDGVTTGYLAEKLKIQEHMVDARALKNLVLFFLEQSLEDNFAVCNVCKLPYLTTNRYKKCYCQVKEW